MSSEKEISYKAGEMAGQAQMKKDEVVDKASEAGRAASQSVQDSKDQAGGFLQQTGERVMSMAQGAAEAVKSSIGIGGDTTTTTGGGGGGGN